MQVGVGCLAVSPLVGVDHSFFGRGLPLVMCHKSPSEGSRISKASAQMLSGKLVISQNLLGATVIKATVFIRYFSCPFTACLYNICQPDRCPFSFDCVSAA